jgi:hypothetical protein
MRKVYVQGDGQITGLTQGVICTQPGAALDGYSLCAIAAGGLGRYPKEDMIADPTFCCGW